MEELDTSKVVAIWQFGYLVTFGLNRYRIRLVISVVYRAQRRDRGSTIRIVQKMLSGFFNYWLKPMAWV